MEFIEGVHYLNTITTPICSNGRAVAVAFMLVLGIIALIVTVAALLDDEYRIALIFSIICILLLVGFFIGKEYVQIGEKLTYEVTIDDSVNVNEFTSKYNIIDIRTNIYEISIKGD